VISISIIYLLPDENISDIILKELNEQIKQHTFSHSLKTGITATDRKKNANAAATPVYK
jgi:hypothetical protein